MADLKREIKVGEKLTVVLITMLAFSVREEVTITDVVGGRLVAKKKGERKPSYLKGEDILFFEGHDLPIRVDYDYGSFFGNNKFNFVAETGDQVREYFKKYCLTELDDALTTKIRWVRPDDLKGHIDVKNIYKQL